MGSLITTVKLVVSVHQSTHFHSFILYCSNMYSKHESISYLWAVESVSSFNQPPVPLRSDTPQSPQIPHQSPSPPDYSPSEVGPEDHAGPVKASSEYNPFFSSVMPSCPLNSPPLQ